MAGEGPFVHRVAGEGFEPSKLSRRIYSPLPLAARATCRAARTRVESDATRRKDSAAPRAPRKRERTPPMADSSFDIVSKIDHQEVDNALSQAAREVAQRYDFKGTGAEIKWSGDKAIEISANAEERAKAVLDVFKEKLIKRD